MSEAVADLKMEFLIKLQTQDFVAAQKIQKELLKLIPNDKMILKFSQYLPAHVEEQIELEKAYEKAEYDPEEPNDYGEEYGDYGKEEEVKDEIEKKSQEDPDAAAVSMVGEEPIFNTEVKPKEEEKSDYDSDYNPEYYDEEGKYIWGEEGEDWEFYDEEDKIAYEQGLSVVPETLNSQALPQDGLFEAKTGVSKPKKKKVEAQLDKEPGGVLYMTFPRKKRPTKK